MYNIRDLESMTGVPRRTIYYWMGAGLLQRPQGRTLGATYSPIHLQRIRDILDIRDARMTNRDIRDRFNPIGDDDE